jgi:hypothetical protein
MTLGDAFDSQGLDMSGTQGNRESPVKRSLMGRAFSAALALAFMLVANRQVLGAGCPHHDGVPHGAQEAGAPAARGHQGSHHAQEVEEGTGQEPAAPAHCTCVGTCHAGAATPLVAGQTGIVSTRAEIHRLAATPSARHVALRPPHSLPFANAPPVHSLS